VPGTYDFPDIAHSPDPRMAATPLTLAAATRRPRRVATLPQWVLDSHGVLPPRHAHQQPRQPAQGDALDGRTAKQEMLPSIVAKYLAPCFGTVQVDPISAGAGDVLSIDGRSLPNVAPTGLRDLLTSPNTPLRPAAAAARRHASTRSTPCSRSAAQGAEAVRRSLATSRQQARSLGRICGHAGRHQDRRGRRAGDGGRGAHQDERQRR
jgi:hypothetical protein